MRNGVYILFVGLCCGVISAGFFPFSHLSIGELVACLAVFTSFCILLSSFTSKKYKVAVIFFIFAFCFGLLRSEMTNNFSGGHELDTLVGKKVMIDGTIVAEPDKRDAEVLLTVKLVKINDAMPRRSINILIFASPGPTYQYGEDLSIIGKLKPITNFKTDSGTEFDYIDYLAKDSIYYSLSAPTIQVLSENNANPLLAVLFKIKQAFVNRVERVIPYPASALLGGLILGAKRSLDAKILDAFTRTGVIHMVVISGYNITIVGNVIASCLAFLPRTFALGGSIVGIFLFICMTGFSGASVRAGLMAATAIAAKFFRRNYDPVRALFLSGFLMIAYNPLSLLHDPSFQLSFVGTLGIMILPGYVEPFFAFVPEKFGIREMIVSSVASQIALLPLILYISGIFSVVALPTNMLVLFPVPLTMLFGFLTGVAGFINFYLSIPFALLAFMMLTYELNLTLWFAGLPFASFNLSFSLVEMIFVYALYVAAIIFLEKRKRKSPVGG